MTGLEIYLPWAIAGTVLAASMGGLVWGIRRDRLRQEALAALAARLGFGFRAQAPGLDAEDYRGLRLFSLGRDRTYRNVINGKPEGTAGLILCDYSYTTGDGKSTQTLRQTVALIAYAKGGLPRFELRPESVLHRVGAIFGYQDIDFKESPRFSSLYLLRGTDEPAVRGLFRTNLREYFEAHPGWCVDGRGSWLAAYRHGQLVKPADIPAFIDAAKVLLWAFPR
ncbi:MAG: hypothetical protein HY926_09415 [Elusimicrobia bacterium]|nr:hypothetical protein [Elusimicrobiota bacterium]